MRFGHLDLNLLVALDALLAERNVTIAAKRLCLSPSATSSALARLRDYFGDELLIKAGQQMTITPRAQSLVEPVRSALAQIRDTISVVPAFEPSTSERTIRIMASDYATEVLLAPAISAMKREAPILRFDIHPINDNPLESLARSHVDLVITPDYSVSNDHPFDVLFTDDYVILGCETNPALYAPITKDLYFGMGHVTARYGSRRSSFFEDWFVKNAREERRIDIVAPSFLTVPTMLLGSSLIATMQRHLAQSVARTMPLRISELPFQVPPLQIAVQSHNNCEADQATRWVVDRLKRVSSQFGAMETSAR